MTTSKTNEVMRDFTKELMSIRTAVNALCQPASDFFTISKGDYIDVINDIEAVLIAKESSLCNEDTRDTIKGTEHANKILKRRDALVAKASREVVLFRDSDIPSIMASALSDGVLERIKDMGNSKFLSASNGDLQLIQVSQESFSELLISLESIGIDIDSDNSEELSKFIAESRANINGVRCGFENDVHQRIPNKGINQERIVLDLEVESMLRDILYSCIENNALSFDEEKPLGDFLREMFKDRGVRSPFELSIRMQEDNPSDKRHLNTSEIKKIVGGIDRAIELSNDFIELSQKDVKLPKSRQINR